MTTDAQAVPFLSRIAREKKIDYFFNRIPKHSRILEIGSGDGWARGYLEENGWDNYVGLDIKPPADIVGDIGQWKELGLDEESFDTIIAFEVIEHVDCFAACHALLKPGGKLMVTTPLPRGDWFLRLLEWCGLNQKRTTPHHNLVDLRQVPCFGDKEIKIVGFLSQWAVLTRD
jgi:SAM-dependent methyltransferase